jgi:hypothetical protein
MFNSYDEKFNIDRRGCKNYEIKNGIPMCPSGRTGLYGRGNLFYYGPNYSILAIFKRINISGHQEVILCTENDENYSLPEVITKNLVAITYKS